MVGDCDRDCDEGQTGLVGFEQDGDGVTAHLRTPSGEETCRAAFLVGCDGTHSTARHTLDPGFGGGACPANACPAKMLPADIRIDWELPRDRIVLNVSREGLLFAAPIAHGGGSWRDPDDSLHARYGADHPRVDVIRPNGPDGYGGPACNTPDLMPVGRYPGGLLQHA